MGKIEFVNHFLHLLHEGKFSDAAHLVTDDIFYHNIPMAPINGKSDFTAFLSKESDLEIGPVHTNWIFTVVTKKVPI